jgi:hypothetical protein
MLFGLRAAGRARVLREIGVGPEPPLLLSDALVIEGEAPEAVQQPSGAACSKLLARDDSAHGLSSGVCFGSARCDRLHNAPMIDGLGSTCNRGVTAALLPGP